VDSGSWARKVEEAVSSETVIALVRDYLATRDPADLGRLPAECAPPRNVGRDEIAEFAYRLAAYHAHDDTARLVQRLGSVISRAAVRLAELDRRPESRAHDAARTAVRELPVLPALRGYEAAMRRYGHLSSAWFELQALRAEWRATTDPDRRRALSAQLLDASRQWRRQFDEFALAFGRMGRFGGLAQLEAAGFSVPRAAPRRARRNRGNRATG